VYVVAEQDIAVHDGAVHNDAVQTGALLNSVVHAGEVLLL
jgi:hypothetical protein